MVEEEEEIIRNLEEIDSNFSSINRTLKDIRNILDKVTERNKSISKDLKPWQNFFDIPAQLKHLGHNAENIEHHYNKDLKRKEIYNTHINEMNSPIVMKFSSPGNPFLDNSPRPCQHDQTSSEIVNRTLLKALDQRFQPFNPNDTTSSTPNVVVKHPSLAEEDEETDSSDIISFRVEALPPIFKDEKFIGDVYSYIADRSSVAVEELYQAFPSLPREKIDIFLDFFGKRHYIKKSGNTYST